MKQYHLLPLSLAFLVQGFAQDVSTESIPLYFISSSELQEEESLISSAEALDETLLNTSSLEEKEQSIESDTMTAAATPKAKELVAQKSRKNSDTDDDEDEDEEDDEEEEEDNTSYTPPPKRRTPQKRIAAAPSSQAQGPQGSLRERRQERAAQIQKQRAQRLHVAKKDAQENTVAESDELSEESVTATPNQRSYTRAQKQRAHVARKNSQKNALAESDELSEENLASTPSQRSYAKAQKSNAPRKVQRTRKTSRATAQAAPSDEEMAVTEPSVTPSSKKRPMTAASQKRRQITARANQKKALSQRQIAQNETPSQDATTPQKPPQTPTPSENQPSQSMPPPRYSPAPQSPKGPPSDKTPSKQPPTSQANPAFRKQRRAIAQASKRPKVAYSAPQKKAEEKPMAPPPPSRMDVPEAVNLSARPVVKNNCIWIDGEAIFWQAYEENLEFVYKGNPASDEWDVKSPDFDWNWGWRVGIGYNLPHDQWDLGLEWLHLNNVARGHAHANPSSEEEPVLYNVWTTTSSSMTGGTEAKSHWENYLNQLDLNIGRQFYVGRWLNLRPHAGLRSAWIFQKYKVDFDGLLLGVPTDTDVHMTNRYWGFGFCAGVGGDWMLGEGFSIYGDAGLALLVGFFHVHQRGTENDVEAFEISKGFRTGRPIFDLDLGLKWATRFNKDRFAFSVKAGYEYHVYSDMNQFLLSNGSTDLELFNPAMGDLSYQGLTLGARFDF